MVVVANPAGLEEYDLGPVDVGGEMRRAQSGLGDIPLTDLPYEDSSQPASLQKLIDRLRRDEHDILYLVCHGTLAKNEAYF